MYLGGGDKSGFGGRDDGGLGGGRGRGSEQKRGQGGREAERAWNGMRMRIVRRRFFDGVC